MVADDQHGFVAIFPVVDALGEEPLLDCLRQQGLDFKPVGFTDGGYEVRFRRDKDRFTATVHCEGEGSRQK